MREEPAFTSLPFFVSTRKDTFRLSLEIGLDKIVPSDQALDVGVSAVIKSINGARTYWALAHTGTEADFHRRDTFTVEL